VTGRLARTIAQSDTPPAERAQPTSDKLGVEVVGWKPLERGTLLGFAEIRIPQLRLRISDLTIHRHESGKRWCGMPGRPRLDRDGSLVRTESGKPEYTPVLRWEGRAVSDASSARVVEALDLYLSREGAA
jgi:hypothetical protein